MSKDLKKLIKEELASILAEEEPGRYHDSLSSAEVAKDELQTAMLDGAFQWLRDNIGDRTGGRKVIQHTYSDLEDRLVDAMMDYVVPGVGVDEATEHLTEERPEEFGVKDWGSDGFHDQGDVVAWAERSQERLKYMLSDTRSNITKQHKAQLISLRSKLVRAVEAAFANGYREGAGHTDDS